MTNEEYINSKTPNEIAFAAALSIAFFIKGTLPFPIPPEDITEEKALEIGTLLLIRALTIMDAATPTAEGEASNGIG